MDDRETKKRRESELKSAYLVKTRRLNMQVTSQKETILVSIQIHQKFRNVGTLKREMPTLIKNKMKFK
ncbi:hypothetical protein KIN20_020970 [Parelaphostrongylus tenuis]|uniref:Uncharacterized protein n=1 Tax=Parelaphostrongylus tenuis TaxID=148309 RepID=A0AAD5MN89_PARTN|nr:hypothetical protein KIN20_020970 [Parelaphostrongylus tenuis]